MHISLSDVDGQPRFGELSVLERFTAGVLTAAPELTAIWAPTWNSYVRLRTAPFAPTDVRVGADDRTAAVRLAGSGDSLRIEARFAGADAQPHLVVAALLAAGLRGVREELPIPPPTPAARHPMGGPQRPGRVDPGPRATGRRGGRRPRSPSSTRS